MFYGERRALQISLTVAFADFLEHKTRVPRSGLIGEDGGHQVERIQDRWHRSDYSDSF